ncbi:MAG: glycosyltransferase family 4 protein [Campylobacterota bacterium]|nr:glycosyltransferase family 4 protein [Campylobacterota bacterium]
MKILAFTKYSYEGPSSRYRFYNYRACFKKHDIEMEIKPFFSKRYFQVSDKIIKLFVVLFSYLKRFISVCQILIFKKKYDLLLLEYELFPYFPAWFEYLLKKRGIKYIVDYDDAIFHKYDMHDNKIIQGLLKNKIGKVVEYADTVIVCNGYLEAYAKKYNGDTFRLPTVVLLDRYKKEMEAFQKNKDDIFVIGWVGSRTTSVYILEILPAIEKFIVKYPHVRFDLVGFDRRLLSYEDAEQYHINIIDWAEEKEIEHILNFDVGIMPLHDDPWSRGKCGFKLVQYMSCKKPVVASPVGMNCTLVQNDKNGFLVETVHEWYDAFEKLYLDENLREVMAKHNYYHIETEYNHTMNCQKYVNLLQERV